MAYRVGEDDIRALLETDEDVNIAPFLSLANILTNRVVTCATDRGVTLSTDEQRAIETTLAAHFYALRDKQYVSKSTERASATFQGRYDLGLDGTDWGQQAKMLDPSGCLESFSSKARAQMFWAGKPPSTQVDYVDRD